MGQQQLCIAETHLWRSHLFPIYAPQLLGREIWIMLHNPSSKPTAFPPPWCPVQVTPLPAALWYRSILSTAALAALGAKQPETWS